MNHKSNRPSDDMAKKMYELFRAVVEPVAEGGGCPFKKTFIMEAEPISLRESIKREWKW